MGSVASKPFMSPSTIAKVISTVSKSTIINTATTFRHAVVSHHTFVLKDDALFSDWKEFEVPEAAKYSVVNGLTDPTLCGGTELQCSVHSISADESVFFFVFLIADQDVFQQTGSPAEM